MSEYGDWRRSTHLEKLKVYCAGPLFNPLEKREMKQISETLITAGHETFLPQEDGLEFSALSASLLRMGLPQTATAKALSRAIFALDVYQLLEWSDAVVANFNGRVPDEGTVAEAALAWHAGKTLVLFKNDTRSILNGSDNPMWAGLGGFEIVSNIEELPEALEARAAARRKVQVGLTLEAGRKISAKLKEARNAVDGADKIARLVYDLFSTRP